jgi:hypothetical protein
VPADYSGGACDDARPRCDDSGDGCEPELLLHSSSDCGGDGTGGASFLHANGSLPFYVLGS